MSFCFPSLVFPFPHTVDGAASCCCWPASPTLSPVPFPPADSDSKLLLLRVVGQFALSCALYRLLPCRATSYLALLNMCDEPDGNQLELENMKLAFRCAHAMHVLHLFNHVDFKSLWAQLW